MLSITTVNVSSKDYFGWFFIKALVVLTGVTGFIAMLKFGFGRSDKNGANWSIDTWANLAQIVSTLGVIISIISLTYQINENTKALKLTEMQATLGNYNAVRLAIMSDGEFSKIALVGFRDYLSLKNEDKFRFDSYMAYLFYSGHAHFTRTIEVHKDSGLWQNSAAFYRSLVQNNPGVTYWWCDTKANGVKFDEEFVRTIESGWNSHCEDYKANYVSLKKPTGNK